MSDIEIKSEVSRIYVNFIIVTFQSDLDDRKNPILDSVSYGQGERQSDSWSVHIYQIPCSSTIQDCITRNKQFCRVWIAQQSTFVICDASDDASNLLEAPYP